MVDKSKLITRTKAAFLLLIISLFGGYGVGWAAPSASSPHSDYTPLYSNIGTCGGSYQGACHTYTKGSFLPVTIDNYAKTNFTKFCLSCHNSAGIAHDKSAGSPSTNTYPNVTGIYSGNSHSWNGVVGNAGTVTPTLFEGTNHMPGSNKVTCQVCHEGMDKVAGIQNLPVYPPSRQIVDTTRVNDTTFQLTGVTPPTKQFLAHYLTVYRDGTFWSSPGPTRKARTKYVVDQSEYTYDYSTATITFLQAQNATDYIYAEIPQPYFRDTNEGNAMCLNCHQDRTSSSVTHSPGTGVNNSHPVVVPYGNISGLHATLKAQADGNIYIEGGQVLCTSCHDPHNAASDDGQITRSANSSDLCTDCHKTNGFDGYTGSQAFVANHNGSKHTAPTECLDCHTPHNTTNIMLLKTQINGRTINFQNFSGAQSFADESGNSVCEACHTNTGHHRNDAVFNSTNKHHTDDKCTKCHPHSTGFGLASGTGCDSCHGFPPLPAPSCWTNETTGGSHTSHMTHLNASKFGYLTGVDACNQCHGNGSGTRGDHSLATDCTGKDSAGMDSTTWQSWTSAGGNWGAAVFSDGSTIGKVSVLDDTCTNVSCHSSGGTRIWGASDCDSCHGYPTSVFHNLTSGGHKVQYDGVSATHLPASGYNAKTDDYVTMTTDVTKCGKCHYNSLGTDANHRNTVLNLQASGNVACGPATAFTINQTTPGSNVTCSNVKCHIANKSTPNWH